MTDRQNAATSRRGLLASAAAAFVGLAGCASSSANTPTPTDTPLPTEPSTDSPTETPTPTETEVRAPSTAPVGEPLELELVGKNPSGRKVWVSVGVEIVDVAAAKSWSRSYQLQFDEGEKDITKTVEAEFGTQHETTLLVAEAAGMTILGGEGYASTTDYQRVGVRDA